MADAEPPLFQSHETLVLTLEAEFSSLRQDRNESTSPYRPAVLSYLSEDGETRSLSLQVKTRGTSRLTRGVDKCSMLLLMLNFRGSDTAGTPFAAQRDVPLVTHCRDRGNFEQYVIREYLAYRSFNLVTDKSLRVRPVRISYVEAGGKPLTTRHAFVVEHFESMALRLGAENASGKAAAINVKKDFDLGVFYVFQFLIGNTDFSVRGPHNVLLLSEPDGRTIAVPYDLDSSGAVNARYAVPDARLKLPGVRMRRYRGFCEPTDVLQQVFDHYLERKDQFYALYDEQEGLTDYSQKKGLNYLDSFFRMLEDSRKIREKISYSCW
ncbi:MAG: hypothetical protein JSV45_14260 [Chromatiales bacterium]|nr:MAG: hypothetical protein JSV45_14260 [Chromatiales bacterium]